MKAGKDVEKMNPYTLLVGILIDPALTEISVNQLYRFQISTWKTQSQHITEIPQCLFKCKHTLLS